MRRLSLLPLVIGILFFTGLEVWPAHAATNGGIIVGGTITDKQGQYRWGSMRIKGTVWLDENVDGIRQPSEPALAGSQLIFVVGGPKHEPVEYKVRAFYLKPGAEPVEDALTFHYSHLGCANLVIPPEKAGKVRLTVDIRVLSLKVRYENQDAPPLNWPLADGHFFKETAHPSHSYCDAGFSVTNADGIPFWDTWQRLGLENVGYPISNRYIWRGFVTQAFQKAIMQWQPGRGVFFVNIFDELHDAGLDEELRFQFSTPRQLDPSFDYTYPVDYQDWVWAEIVGRRIALLDANPAIKEKYYSAPAPLLQYGLPTSRVKDHGNQLVIRTQRAVFRQWKQDVPWARAGEVTVANSGDIAKALDRLTCWKPDGLGTSTTLCKHLFFSEEVVKNWDPPALIPHTTGFVGVRPP